MAFLRSSVHVGLFLLGLLGTAAGIRSVDALPFWSWSRAKLAHLLRHADDYDTVFLGTSRVLNGILPVEFDARMAELGTPTRSFNLALSGLLPNDISALVDWLVAQPSLHLKRAIVELHAFEQGERGGQWMTDFQVEMHAPALLGSRLESVWLSRHPWWSKLEIAAFVCAHTAANALRIGQGGRVLDDLLLHWRGEPVWTLDVLEHGFHPVGGGAQRNLQMEAQHEAWLADPSRGQESLATRKADLTPAWLRGGFNRGEFVRQMQRLRDAGIEPIFVVMPVWHHNFWGREGVADVTSLATVIELDRPLDHPSLYRFEMFYDRDHPVRAGAEMLSRYLAEQIVERARAPVRETPAGLPRKR